MENIVKVAIILCVVVGVIITLASWAIAHPPPKHTYKTYTAVIEDKVVEHAGSGKSSYGVTLCVFTDHLGKKHTFSDQDRWGDKACLLKIGDKIQITYDETWETITQVTPVP